VVQFWIETSKVKVRLESGLAATQRGFELYECLVVLACNHFAQRMKHQLCMLRSRR